MTRVIVVSAAAVLALSVAGTAAPRGQRIPLTMGDFTYTPARVEVPAGSPVEFLVTNRGKVKHELMIHPMPAPGLTDMALHEWAEGNSFLRGLTVKVEGGGVEVEGREIYEVMIAPGRSATVKFTPTRKGTYEYACLIKGHYEEGMKGRLVVK